MASTSKLHERSEIRLRQSLKKRLLIPQSSLEAVNSVLRDTQSGVISDFLAVVEKYGSPDEINRKAAEASQMPSILKRLEAVRPEYLDDLRWLQEQRERGAFIKVQDYRRKILGSQAAEMDFRDKFAVTLEVSAAQYFPWLVMIARQAIERGELMPGRFIRVRKMKEQEADGDLLAFSAARQIFGASYVEQLDTRGVDGSNIHLGGPDTLIGYFGGVGQPNDHPLQWLDEYLYYYTNYGVRQVLNLNSGTVLMGLLLHRIGVDIEFKISVALGNDNPYSALWTMLLARLFARPDGSSPLAGFNWSSSTDPRTLEIASQVRKELGFEDIIRFEYHATQTWKGIVIQPYCRRQDIVNLADHVPNISAKHEGGDPDVECNRPRPSEIQDYYRDKEEILASGDWEALTLNFLDKFEALNRTAEELTRHGLSFIAARNLHY